MVVIGPLWEVPAAPGVSAVTFAVVGRVCRWAAAAAAASWQVPSAGAVPTDRDDREQDAEGAEDGHHPRRRRESGGEGVGRRLAVVGPVGDHAAVDRRGQRGRDGGADVPGHVGDAGGLADLVLGDRGGGGRRRRAVGQAHADGDRDQRQQERGVLPGRVDEADRGEADGRDQRSPTPIIWRPPSLLASRGTKGATTTRPTVAGRVARPACSGVKPRAAGFWK